MHPFSSLPVVRPELQATSCDSMERGSRGKYELKIQSRMAGEAGEAGERGEKEAGLESKGSS
jgi:hypothetical protein